MWLLGGRELSGYLGGESWGGERVWGYEGREVIGRKFVEGG